jgi:hypothetical protein
MHIGYWWEGQKERDNIKMELREIGWDGMVGLI